MKTLIAFFSCLIFLNRSCCGKSLAPVMMRDPGRRAR